MIVIDSHVVWSASDLTTAADCEYSLLRRLDVKFDRAGKAAAPEDALQAQIAQLGLAHEARVLGGLVEELGDHTVGCPGGVTQLRMAVSTDRADLEALAVRTRSALADLPHVVSQAGFFDGEFHGYADFLRLTPEGWVVADTKIARTTKVGALLQVAAYADQVARMGQPVAPTVEIILGTGATAGYPLDEIMPVFRERRERLRTLVARHATATGPTDWCADDMKVCGSCVECSAAATHHQDLVLVAGMRMSQREKLRNSGITTVEELAAASGCPREMGSAAFVKLRAQAAIQLEQMETEAAGTPQVFSEIFDPEPILALPEPSMGDLFFDFEGDPMFHLEGSDRWGLEYLWGVQPARDADGGHADFWHLWADDLEHERTALVEFLDRVASLRAVHPDMHVYHYAPYEITALKRLVAVHKTHEDELDDLLRHGVFVDLYATVRGSLRVSQPSYSIKKLEPLYMEERVGEVMGGDASIAEYQAYRDSLGLDDGAAARHRANLIQYNSTDCVSTLELRDWLLGQVDRAQRPVGGEPDLAEARPPVDDEVLQALRARLLARSGPAEPSQRSGEEQSWAMLESALDYYKREDKPFWWSHFDRLMHEPDEWADVKDVVVVESPDDVVLVSDWAKTGRERLNRRRIRLTGRTGPGTTLKPDSKVWLLYDAPGPEQLSIPVQGLRGWMSKEHLIADVQVLPDGRLAVEVTEVGSADHPDHDLLPMAVVPGRPVPTTGIAAAIRTLAEASDEAGALPEQPGADVLQRTPPRTRSGGPLWHSGSPRVDLVATLLDLDRSYLAVQGPPGTGKTYLGSHVIAELVRRHRWKIGVVAQSHAVVENMLSAIIKAGLDPSLVGKVETRTHGDWTTLGKAGIKGFTRYAEERRGSGFVFGGTAWNFTNQVMEREGLDLLVIDEAGQFSLASTLAVSPSAQRLLLLGDPQQLPQVSQGTHGEPVNESALTWVMDGAATMPRDRGYFLETSYRMHSAVCAPVSRLSYAGELQAAPSASTRLLEGVEPGLEVVKLRHSGNSVSCPQEADEVVRRVEQLMGARWTDPAGSAGPRPLAQHDFLVVAPYNAQRQLIRDRLDADGYPDVRVGTVDKFQGQEAPVVLVSMTASSAAEVPRGVGFLLDRHRVNVAVSRAQWLAVLIRSEDLTGHVPSSPEDLLELGAFVGLCEGVS